MNLRQKSGRKWYSLAKYLPRKVLKSIHLLSIHEIWLYVYSPIEYHLNILLLMYEYLANTVYYASMPYHNVKRQCICKIKQAIAAHELKQGTTHHAYRETASRTAHCRHSLFYHHCHSFTIPPCHLPPSITQYTSQSHLSRSDSDDKHELMIKRLAHPDI